MSNWEQFGNWFATLAVASFAWVSSVVASDVPALPPTAAGASASGENELSSLMRWAQQDDEPPVEQVGEDTAEDIETLDDAAPPADEGDTAEDIELLDQVPPVDAQAEDVELLDQGPPPETAAEPPAPSTATTVPVTTYVAPAAPSGPVLPEGFGTGNVHAATGSAGFPVGLEDCHVGAVTGRAYVGIDCDEGGESSFVGHAPSFDEFPFVLDESFPFGEDSIFADRDTSKIEEDVQALIATARGAPLEDEAAPEIRTSGASSVEFEQRARDRKPRVETDDGRVKRSKDARRRGNAEATQSRAQDADDRATTESKQKKKKSGKGTNQGGTSADKEKKTKNSKQERLAEKQSKKR